MNGIEIFWIDCRVYGTEGKYWACNPETRARHAAAEEKDIFLYALSKNV